MKEIDKDIKVFSSLNGLGRPATMAGVPIKMLLTIVGLTLTLSFIAQIFFGMLGFLVLLFAVPFILLIRQLTASDDHAIRILFLELKYFFKRLVAGDDVFKDKTKSKVLFLSSEVLNKNVKYFKQYFKASKFSSK
jgi:type IV secretory pathway VirB3-like protein